MKTSEKGTKKFTKAEKLAIIKEAKEKGIPPTLAKYNVYRGTFDYWNKKYLVYGDDGLDHRKQKDLEEVNKKLEKENAILKVLLAEKELESKLKDEQLKKKYPELRKFL